jgi:hypothetical protein
MFVHALRHVDEHVVSDRGELAGYADVLAVLQQVPLVLLFNSQKL